MKTTMFSKVDHCFKKQNMPPVVHLKPKSFKHNQNQFSFSSFAGRYYVFQYLLC